MSNSIKKQSKLRSTLTTLAGVPIRVVGKFPLLTTAALAFLIYQGHESYQEKKFNEQIQPRKQHAEQMTHDMIRNGMDIADPDRQTFNAEAHLRAALDRIAFTRPEQIGDNTDKKNVNTALALQWAISKGVKIMTDTQMHKDYAVMWHPKERVLAVNGTYNVSMLSSHIEAALMEIFERASEEHFAYIGARELPAGKHSLKENFAITIQPYYPLKQRVINEQNLTKAQIGTAPIKKAPKVGS